MAQFMSFVSTPSLVSTQSKTAAVRTQSACVLDDEAEVGKLVSQVLKTCGYAPLQFTAPAAFFKQVEASAPALIVLDLALGQSDAVEIIRRLEVLKFKGKILLISGRDEATLAEIAEIGTRHGMTMLVPLKKPFRANDIRARLAEPDADAPSEAQKPRVDAKPTKRSKIQFTEALRQNWLELWYQPKIDLKTLSVCGAEGLLRAKHPERGIIGPADILPPAGDSNHVPLAKFVLERAMRDWNRFAHQGLPIRLAINVPVSVLTSPNFIALVRQALPTRPNFPGLIIEVTEDEVIRDPEWTREIAMQLKLYNVHLSIDDFGSAYASLSRLKDLPVTEIKIDQSFVQNCSSDQTKRVICQTVVDLAHGFGASVCAEGVETAEDLRTLVSIGADTVQGFLFAKPMPADGLLEKLSGSARASMPSADHAAGRK
jgi:EAL domain-containing protein (putative c-di-GMP-specific phosphodiesterase class I)/FixJ family two-component response regulator